MDEHICFDNREENYDFWLFDSVLEISKIKLGQEKAKAKFVTICIYTRVYLCTLSHFLLLICRVHDAG